ncbi:MAG TPA: PAS domain S-box protein, partial [Planctomycetota bacterium]|nr:PAS domain S-box protein [Planctomycetota bacterium]
MTTLLEACDHRAVQIFTETRDENYRRTDRLFAGLMVCQWLAGIAAACWITPATWVGSESRVHDHVYLAVLLGGALAGLPLVMAITRPGAWPTRHVIGACQALTSALLIHLSGGRIETHFHIFGSLAFLSFYRDWRVLVTATAIVAGDHFVRGVWAPESVFGVLSANPWRWLEHAGWVVFEDCFLVYSCRRGVLEMRENAGRWALIEATNETVEQEVVERTGDLERSERLVRTILESAADGIIGFDVHGRASFSNPAGERLLGRVGDRLLGCTLEQLFGAETAAGFGATAGKVMECRIARPDGSSLTCELTCSSTAGTAGPAGGLVVSLRDVTQHKDLQSQLVSSQKLEAIGQLAAGIAHEINTPTQYIGDNVRFLRDALADIGKLIDSTAVLAGASSRADIDAAVDHLRALHRATDFAFLREECPGAISQSLEGVERVTRIVYSMKEFAHPDRDEASPVDVNQVITSATTVCRNEWKYVADLRLDLDPVLPRVHGYAGALGQVVLNLVVNAAHAIAEHKGKASANGQITVRSRLDGDAVV